MRKRLLLIGPYPPPYAGPELLTRNLLESGLTTRFRVSHLNTNVRRSNTEKGRLDLMMAWALAAFAGRLIGQLLRTKPHVVYHSVTATLPGWIRDTVCIGLCALFRRKVVIQLQGGHFRLFYDHSCRPVQGVIRFLLSRAALTLVQGEGLRDQFQGLVPAERIRVLPNCVRCEDFPEKPCPTAGEPDLRRGKVVFHLGHLSHAKGYCDLLKAIPRVVDAFPKVVFHLAGTKMEGHKFRERNVLYNQLTRERLRYEDPKDVYEDLIDGTKYEGHVKYLGVVAGREKLSALQGADVFVSPSYSEGLSTSMLEAMAVGLPVVVTPVGAHAEVVVDGVNGFLVEPGDVNSLAERLVVLLRDEKLCARMGRANADRVRREFDVSRVAEMLSAYCMEPA